MIEIKYKNMKNNKTTMALASVGALGGLYYAFKKGKGFWGYAGFFVLGSIVGHLAGNVVTSVIPQPKSDDTKNATPSAETTEDVSNATGQQIGTTACTSQNNSLCQEKCEDMGGTFNSVGDRRCYKNGIAISVPPFGYGSRMKVIR
jgi:hypothetical protein